MRAAPPPSSVEDPVDQFNLGLRFSKARCAAPKVAFEWYRKAAKQGYAPAQHNLAVCYATGVGTSQDEVLAAHWYRKAALQGHAPAQCNLGACYALGEGVPVDDSMAVSWTRKAAVQGYVAAQCNLASFYTVGRGVGVSYSIAAAWFRKAADRGSDLAAEKYREMRKNGVKPATLSGQEESKSKSPGQLSKGCEKRRKAESFRGYSEERSSGRVEVSPCPICKVRIANHALKSHIREYHRPEPKLDPNAPKHLPAKKDSGPKLPALPAQKSPSLSLQKRSALESLCPRCGGDGGVRGGCGKCDGSGWVPSAMEHDLFYRPDHAIGENSRISNADYLGGNGGAHFREIDGRIGTNPGHDDYSEEGRG
ncbi:tetratricopeptide repeat protein [Pseudomonas putida]|uniref:tetratricopeptide repeat protein n=1 Tax=Pseudomonas putida TaxID=303 RepID=UPI0039FCB883